MKAIRRGWETTGRAARGVTVALVLAAPAWAQQHVERPDAILSEARTAPALRAALIAHAKHVQKKSPFEAADALMYAGESSDRSALPDSAAICYRQAARLTRSNEPALALTDLLLREARARDLLEAYEVVANMLGRTPPGAADRGDVMLRAMWLQHLAGHPDSAAIAYREAARSKPSGVWAVRAAHVLLDDIKDPASAGRLLLPLEVASRGQDPEVHGLFVRSVTVFGRTQEKAVEIVNRELAVREAAEAPLLQRLNAKRLPFSASDGFLLSSVVRPAPAGAPAAVVMSMGDTLADYDSLITHLSASGFAVILVDARGHGYSVGPPCSLPFRWAGREHQLEERIARDALESLEALGDLGPVDTTRSVIVGVGFTARAALRAAELQPHFRAIVLASPEPARVDRGLMIASMARLKRPAFIQTAPEDLVQLYYFADALYQAGDRRGSRVSSGKSVGRFAAQFNRDGPSGVRLRRWLADVMPAAKR